MQQPYVAIIEKGLDGYGVFFPDLPGLTSFGATVGEAAANAAVAAQGHAATLAELGEELPQATPLEAIEVEDDIDEAARVLVLVETSDEKQRVNITLPRSILAALDGIAQLRGQDRSSMIADLVRNAFGAPAESSAHSGMGHGLSTAEGNRGFAVAGSEIWSFDERGIAHKCAAHDPWPSPAREPGPIGVRRRLWGDAALPLYVRVASDHLKDR
jgi:predicted RNase H-like HicB family nuclease